MKQKKLLSSMELIDEKYIEEASPERKKGRRSLWLRVGAIAAAIAITVTSASVWLFAPYSASPPDVSKHSDSQYYPLIQKLNALTFKKPKFNTKYDELLGSLFAKEQTGEITTFPTSEPGITKEPNYVETTDNQVSGVIEADLIKRSDEYIFYLRNNELSVYPINGASTECLSVFTVSTEAETYYSYGIEMYLSEDCSTLSIILPCYSGNKHLTQIVSLDVSNPADITEKDRISVSGAYVSSRLTDGRLLLVTNFTVQNSPDFSDESAFLPEIKTKDKVIRPAMANIVCPEAPSTPSFAVVTMLDPQEMSVLGSAACLSYSLDIYASDDSIYLTRCFSELTESEDGGSTDTAMTEITRIAYSDDRLTHIGSVTVKGSVRNQYSLDEYNGVLRVAVTTRSASYSKKSVTDGASEGILTLNASKTNASLYCIDKETLEILAAVENFAPEGESLQSSRFDGDTAYICTSLQLSDPVFFFDLSNLDSITVKDTGTIEGFSSSLINLGDGYLLGIGVGSAWDSVKIEIYREAADRVISVCSKEIASAYYSVDYKSYFIDRENRNVGLMLTPASSQRSEYYLLHFDGTGLITLLKEDVEGSRDTARGVFIENCFYIFTDEDFKVKALS